MLNSAKTKLAIFCLALVCTGTGARAQVAVAPEGKGTADDPCRITSMNNLVWLSDEVKKKNPTEGKFYKLMNDIDASATAKWNGGTGFTPIGYYKSPEDTVSFCGNFEGNGKTIKGLTINRPEQDFVGLFGLTGGDTSRVTNLTIDGGLFVARNFSGCLVGETNGGSIENCVATASIKGYGKEIGGLIGCNHGGCVVTSCSATGAVSGNDVVGGLVGQNIGNSLVTRANASGTIHATEDCAGGLVGDNAARVSRSSASGSVTGFTYVGGLVGYNRRGSNIENSFATGNAKGIKLIETMVGGLVGENFGTVRQCYATGKVIGTFHFGGLVGYNTANVGGLIADSYWNKDTTGCATSADSPKTCGKTTDEMSRKATFAGWDFDKIWSLAEGDEGTTAAAPQLR